MSLASEGRPVAAGDLVMVTYNLESSTEVVLILLSGPPKDKGSYDKLSGYLPGRAEEVTITTANPPSGRDCDMAAWKVVASNVCRRSFCNQEATTRPPPTEANYARRRRVKRSTRRPTGPEPVAGLSPPFSYSAGWKDHMSLWNRNGRPAIFVSQPYQMHLCDLKSLVKCCEDLGLDCTVTTRSWYNFGETLMIEIYKEGALDRP